MKTIRELNLCDDFLFHEVMLEEDMVRPLLEEALELKGRIRKITYIQDEKTIRSGYAGKGIRLDVYVEDGEETVYDVEMQQVKNRSLALRSRKYQSNIDQEMLKRGQDYDKLKKQYIIFICTFDPYGGGLHRYTFTNRCRETSQEMGDGTCKVFLSTRGTADDVSPELRAFLDFVEDSSPQNAERLDDDFVRDVSRRIESIKADEEMGGVFMTFEEKLDEVAKEAARQKDQEYAEKMRAAKEDLARKMKQKGYPLDDIIEISGLCREEIEAL